MEQTPSCPDNDSLERYLLGRVGEPEAEQVERHVAGCWQCLERLRSLPAEDVYVTVMRGQVRADQTPTSPAVVDLMQRLCGLRPPRPAGNADTTTASGEPSQPSAGGDTLGACALLTPPQAPDELGRLGGYRVLAVLGAGGMGVVFRAEDVQLRRVVALKVVRPELRTSGSALPRFLREARATASLTHDHIVTIYQVGEERGVPFLAMQLLQGETLEARLQRRGRLPVAEVLRIGREMAAGLAAAHASGLVHRDVKPSNIWLEAGTDRVKILDFGLVRAVRDTAPLTREGAIVGTPDYMAPEQTRGEPVDPRSDLFSLGSVLYRMVTGVAPFAGPDPIAILVAVATVQPAEPRQLNPDVPPRLSALIRHLLAKQPGDRPASARVVAAELEAVAHVPDGKTRRAHCRSLWPRGVGVAVALVAVVLALTGYGFYLRFPGAPQQVARPPGEVCRLEGHTDIIDCVAFLPAGLRALSGGWDRTLRLWDVQTGQQLLQFPQPAAVHCLAVAPDGRFALAAGGTRRQKDGPEQPGDYAVHLWDLEKGKEVKQFAGHRDKVTGLAFLPSGSEFLSLSWDGTLRRWDWKTGQQLAVLEKDAGPLRSLALMPGGKQAVSGSAAGVVRLWDVAAGEALAPLQDSSAAVDCLAVTPDGTRVLAGGADKVVRVWDVASGKLAVVLRGHTERIWCVAVAPDGKHALTGSLDRTLRLWDVQTGKELHVFAGHEKGVQCVTFSPDGRRALSASSDRTVRLWQLP